MSDDGPSGALADGPLPLWAAAALLGAWCGSEIGWGAAGPGPGALVAVGGLGISLAGLRLGRRGRPDDPGRLATTAVVAVGVVVVTLGLGWVHAANLVPPPLRALVDAGRPVAVAGVIVHEPRVADARWWSIVRVERVGDDRYRTRMLVHGTGAPPPVGSRVAATATIRSLGHGGFASHVRRLHAGVAARADAWSVATPPGAVLRTVERVRARVRATFGRHLRPELAALATGLVTGDTRGLPAAHADAMRAAGLSHLTAVSGSNVALVLAGVAAVARLLGLPIGLRRTSLAAAAVAFLTLTRFEPSVLRATTMVLLALVADARGGTSSGLRALAGTLLVLVLVDPLLAGSLGLLLSSAATAGILVVAPRVARRLAHLPPALRFLVAATVAAQIAVAPLLVAAGSPLPLSGIAANLVAVPAATVAGGIGAAAAVTALVAPAAAASVVFAATPALSVVLAVAGWAASTGPLLSVERPGLLVAASGAAGWLATRRGGRAARHVAAVTAVGLVVTVLAPLARAPAPGDLRATAIDVGQGDAVLVESARGRVLVDAGGDAAAATWLRATGRGHVDLVVVSHDHHDHVGGLTDVVESVRIGQVWHHPVLAPSPATTAWMGAARARRVPVRTVRSGHVARVGDLRVEVWAPTAGRPFAGDHAERNESSLVVTVGTGGRRVLLPGDVEEGAQARLVGRLPPRPGVLKVPHHGAATSSTAFLRSVAAPIALISVGRGNRYGHPAPSTLAVLAGSGSRIRRTDLEGTVTVAVPATVPVVADARRTPARTLAHARGLLAGSGTTGTPDIRTSSPAVGRQAPRRPVASLDAWPPSPMNRSPP